MKIKNILCYAIVFEGRRSVFRPGIRPDSNRESLRIDPPEGQLDFDHLGPQATPTRRARAGPENGHETAFGPPEGQV
jgi:hypothetical protein